MYQRIELLNDRKGFCDAAAHFSPFSIVFGQYSLESYKINVDNNDFYTIILLTHKYVFKKNVGIN